MYYSIDVYGVVVYYLSLIICFYAQAGHGQANEVPKTFNPNASYVPNGHPSISYYYGGKVRCYDLSG